MKMEFAKVVNEREYEVLRVELLQLKKRYLTDLLTSDIQTITPVFIQNVKKIQNKYLSFLEKYLIEESNYPDFLKHFEMIFDI